MSTPGGGRGRRRGGGRGGGGDDSDASPEWLPPQQRRELENARVTRSTRARRGGGGGTQDFMDRPDIRQAGGLAVLQPGGGAVENEERGGEDEEYGGRSRDGEVRERLALQLHRQQDMWVPGPNVGIRVLPDGQGEELAEAADEADEGEEGQEQPDPATQPPPNLPPRPELPSLEELHTTLVPTLKWCPKAARGEFARELASLWFRLAQTPNDVRLWVLQAMFVRCILPAGRGPRAGDAYSMARLVRERLRRWRAGEFSQLWQEAVNLTKVPARKKKKGDNGDQEKSQEQKNAERAATLAQDGQFTRALQALTSAGMAPPTSANLKTMKEKHPEATSAPLIPPNTDLPQISFTQVEVEKAAKKFRKGSAPGPSGLRPEHLRVGLQAAPGRRDRALQSLTQLVNSMAAGGVPEEVAPFLAGARLHAARKKDGGLRPIAVGNLMRRLVAKCCASKLQERAASLLKPHQLGVGVRNGCEAIVHSVRKVLEADPSLWCLQADFKNAFNLVDRDVAMGEVLEKFPEILSWVKTCYGQPSHLLFGSTSISSQLGFHQGDPLAALLFCLVLQPLVNLIEERAPGLACNAWFLDDGTLVGKVEDLCTTVDILMQEGPSKGLVLSTTHTVNAPDRPKSTIWCPNPPVDDVIDPSDPCQRGLIRITEEGVVLLGAPLGSAAFVESEVKKKVSKVEDVTELLPLIEDSHTEYALLRSCLSLPKLSFLLRAVDTSDHGQHLQAYDRITREALTRILGTPIGDKSWQQAKLPVGMGGLGLRAAEDQAPAAYAASVLSSKTLVQSLLGAEVGAEVPVVEGEELLGSLHPRLLAALAVAQGEQVTEGDLTGLSQRMISLKVDQHQLQQLQEQVPEDDVREKARLASLSLPHSGDWLNCAPLKALGLHLRSAEFVLAVKYRLGLPIFDQEGPCPACLRQSDIYGDHALCCGTGGERISRHNALRDAFYDTLSVLDLGLQEKAGFSSRALIDVLPMSWCQTGWEGVMLPLM